MRLISLALLLFFTVCADLQARAYGGSPQSDVAPLYARTYYVCDTGSDRNDGLDINNPALSVDKISYKARSGERILLCGGGTFSDQVIVPKSDNITYGVYNPIADFVGTASIADNVMTVVSKTSGGTIGIGSRVTISGLYKNYFGVDLPVYVVGLGNGSGGTGTYYINPNLPDGETLTVATTSVVISGKKPIISGTGTSATLSIHGLSSISIDGIVFSNDSYRVGYVGTSKEIDGLSIKNSAFIQTTSGSEAVPSILRIEHSTAPLSDVVFEGNLVVGSEYAYVNGNGGVLFSGTNSLENISITENAFYNIQDNALSIWHWDKATIIASNSFPSDVTIEDNVFSNIAGDAIHAMSGLLGVSSVSRNTAYNIGSDISPNINAIQSGYWVNTIVEYNDVRNVKTSVSDGDGIILDWAWTEDARISSGIIARYNYIESCLDSGTGIAAYKAKDSKIYGNVVKSCVTGIGNSNSASSNNEFYNNTIIDTTRGFKAGGYYSASAEAKVFNNIFSGCTYGLIYDFDSLKPVENNNLFYNCTTPFYDDKFNQDQDLSASDIIADPLFVSGGYSLSSGSPAIGAGVLPLGESSVTDMLGVVSTDPNMGAFQ